MRRINKWLSAWKQRTVLPEDAITEEEILRMSEGLIERARRRKHIERKST